MIQPFSLHEGEHMVLQFRKHWICLVRDTIGTLAASLLPFILFPIVASFGHVPEQLLSTQVVAFASAWWLLIIWCSLAVIWTDYYLDTWIITDQRVISFDQVGLFNRSVSTWGIERIQEVTTQSENFLQTLLNYGTLQIQTAGSTEEFAHAHFVPDPEKVRAAIITHSERMGLLEATNRNQAALLHTVSHEVKSYLTKDAAALASIAAGDLGTVPPQVQTLAGRALSETRRGVSALMDLLGDSNASTGAIHLQKTTFDISAMITALAHTFESEATRRGLSFSRDIPNAPLLVSGDETKLRDIVFRALIENSMRYTPRGSVRITLERTGSKIRFSIKDTGVGIEPKDMQRLFQDGGHGAHSREINPDSTGYGLSGAKRLVEAHGGTITANSPGLDKGSEFAVELPAA